MPGPLPNSMMALTANQSIITRLFHHARRSHSERGASIKHVPLPTICDEEILVKVTSVALNPTDFKHIDVASPRGARIGCDYAGRVVKIGSQAPGNWSIGDRVAGFVHGGIYAERGSFAEYLKIPADLAWKIPETISDDDASTYGISAVTAMLALNTRLEVPWIDEGIVLGRKDTPILIYAGSTSAGLFAIQIAKLAGLMVIATSSPHSFDLLQKYGVDEAFDYRSQSAAEQIVKKYPNIDRALDCFSEGTSTKFCVEVVKKNKGKVVTLNFAAKSTSSSVCCESIFVYTAFGLPFQLLPPVGPKFPAHGEDREALAHFYRMLPSVCTKLNPPPIEIIDGGLETLMLGLSMLRDGKVSGRKLVSRIS